MLRLKRKTKNKGQGVDERRLNEILQEELHDYIKQEDLQWYLDRIERDKKKKAVWGSLSMRKKIKVLRYVSKKEGGKHAKKQRI